MVRRVLTFLASVVLAGIAGAPPAAATDAETLMQTGEAELRAAAIGTAGAADRALAAFDAALQVVPSSVRARAGRGLALIAQALEAPIPHKLALARRGCAELDAAVAAAPDDAAVRLMRATSAMKMPLLLERQAVAESDFALLLAAARDDGVTMRAATRRGIFYHAAAFALKERRTGAIELLEEAARISATEPGDEQIQSMLALARQQTKTSPTHADRHSPAEAPASGP